MKKLYLFSSLLLLICFSGNAQNLINNHWQLGQTDLNFTNVAPTAGVVTNGNYGKASISDSAGNLLFYTNGYNVWNKNHGIMTNGGAIVSALENYDFINTVIVPNPGNNQQYYIISSVNVACLCFYLYPTVYTVSMVEFNASNPLGIVLPISIGNSGPSSTNFSKEFPGISNGLYFGPLTVTKSSDGVSYWIIMQKGNVIQSYKVGNTGLNLTPVESTFTNLQVYNLGSYNSSNSVITGIEGGDFKIAPNNAKLVGLQYSRWGGSSDPDGSTDPAGIFKNNFYSLDFNATTGSFTNYQLLTGTDKAFYEYEISNNSNYLYFIRLRHPSAVNSGSNVQDGEVVVKDLTNNATPVRVLNEFNTTTPSTKFSYIQKDRNGNILISSTFTTNNRNKYVHKIESQDNFTTSSVNVNYLYLNNYTIHALPQLIPEFVVECPDITLTTETNMNSYTYVDKNTITTQTNYVVDQTTQDIRMYANSYILLKPNTHIKTGSKYLAAIKGCTMNNKYSEESSFEETGYDEVVKKGITLYPNPTNSILNVSSTDSNLKSIAVYSIEGKLIYSQNLKDISSYQLNVSDYSKGLYIINVQDEKGLLFSEKFIKN